MNCISALSAHGEKEGKIYPLYSISHWLEFSPGFLLSTLCLFYTTPVWTLSRINKNWKLPDESEELASWAFGKALSRAPARN